MASETSWTSGFLDEIELDCMHYESAARYTSFEKLPDEILLLILKSLDTSDLLKTVLVCRRIQPVVQQVLYGCIKETVKYIKNPFLFPLIKTLRDRPQLARLVQSIELRAIDRYDDIELYPTRSLQSNDTHEDCEKVIASASHSRTIGIMLWLLPQLTKLTLKIDHTRDWAKPEQLAVVLGPEYSLSRTDHIAKLHRVPAFQNLLKLRFVGTQEFPWSLSLLPKLKTLHLRDICSFSKNQNRKKVLEKSPVEELSVQCDVDVLGSRSPGPYNAFGPFLGIFSSLKSIELHITTLVWKDGPKENAGCSNLINRLKVLSGTLEKLNIFMAVRHFHMKPVGSWVSFSKIRELGIPYSWLEDERHWEESSPFDADYSTLFPQNLEVLELRVPNNRVCGWLAEFANQRMKRGDLVKLRQINLVCMTHYHGGVYEELRYHPGPRALLNLMRNQGVSVELTSTKPLPEWDDENYDPVSALFLTQLSKCSETYSGGVVWDGFAEKAARMSGYQAIKISHIELPSRRIPHRFQ